MALIPPHEHQFKKYVHGTISQWVCTVPLCKAMTRNAIDILGTLVCCVKCKKIFRFEDEDIPQVIVCCPVCNKSADPRRIGEMIQIESTIGNVAAVLMGSEMAKKPDLKTVNQKQAEKMIIADLMKGLE